jgi:hypothetical protein
MLRRKRSVGFSGASPLSKQTCFRIPSMAGVMAGVIAGVIGGVIRQRVGQSGITILHSNNPKAASKNNASSED